MDDALDELVTFTTDDGSATITVATSAGDTPGARPISRRGQGELITASRTFESSLEGARTAAEAALRVFRDGRLKPDSVEIEFGVRLTAETGAVLIKGSADAHLVVKLAWAPGRQEDRNAPEHRPTPAESTDPAGTAAAPGTGDNAGNGAGAGAGAGAGDDTGTDAGAGNDTGAS